jgi:sporulation protein YlmC with PRC-barrel domain
VTPHSIPIVPKRADARPVAPGLLAHFSDLDDDYMIADPIADFRHWDITLPDGRRVGKVDDLIVDTSTWMVKYVEAKIDKDVLLADEDRYTLLPVESVRLDEADAHVVIDHLPIGGLAGAPRQRDRLPTPEEQRAILAYFEIVPVGAPHG